ncbi:hypothetical protein GCM10010430_01460 [Kitasatospora cystarginea]|uniref:Uncharacterized protein n=1 Tax=Kitasatospora cystarginea TaxID=58350 RepID=A0ABP5Q4Y0_9ACTN
MVRERVEDLVVVVPGIMGSRLVDADGRPIWDLSGGALLRGIRAFAGTAPRLAVRSADPDFDDGVRAVGLMRDLHDLPGTGLAVDGHSRLLD